MSEIDKDQTTETQVSKKRLLDDLALAERFYISRRGVWRAVARKELAPPVKIGRCSRWFPADVEAFEQLLLERRSKQNPGGFSNN
jgi:predicted DNA-binding transcriptional regulator AlpA